MFHIVTRIFSFMLFSSFGKRKYINMYTYTVKWEDLGKYLCIFLSESVIIICINL